MCGLTHMKNVKSGCVPQEAVVTFSGWMAKVERSVMRHFYKVLSGIGFITALLGMGCMDSASMALPIVMLFGGLLTFYFGMRMAEDA